MKTMSMLAAIAALACAATGAHARAPIPGQGSPVPANCPLVIAFTSYGAGIDRPALERVERYLARERRVARVSRHPWGREGEVTLCARTRSTRDAIRLTTRIRALIPARPRGPIRIERGGVVRYETPAPRH